MNRQVGPEGAQRDDPDVPIMVQTLLMFVNQAIRRRRGTAVRAGPEGRHVLERIGLEPWTACWEC